MLLLRNIKDGGFLTNVKGLRLETDQISVYMIIQPFIDILMVGHYIGCFLWAVM